MARRAPAPAVARAPSAARRPSPSASSSCASSPSPVRGRQGTHARRRPPPAAPTLVAAVGRNISTSRLRQVDKPRLVERLVILGDAGKNVLWSEVYKMSSQLKSRHQRRSFSEASALGPCASPPRLMDNSTANMDKVILSSLRTRMKSWNSSTKKLPTDAEVMKLVLSDVGMNMMTVPHSSSSEKRSRDEHDDSAYLENAKKATYSESVGKQSTGLGSAQNETEKLENVSKKLERSLSGPLLYDGLDLVKEDLAVGWIVLGLSDHEAGKYIEHCLNK